MNWTPLLKIALGVGVVCAILALLLLHQCNEARTAGQQSKLDSAHAGAVVGSAIDAGNSAAAQRHAESNLSDTVKDTKNEIDAANDAAGVDDAFRNGLRATRKANRPR